MIILDGKKTSNDIKAEIAESVKEIVAKGLRPPHLAAVIVGDDGASLTYVGSKVRACKRVGFESTLIKLPESISENELLVVAVGIVDKEEVNNDLLNENQKLKKDNKNIFAQKIELDKNIIELKEKISEQQIEIDSYLEEIKKLKDKSHHGR